MLILPVKLFNADWTFALSIGSISLSYIEKKFHWLICNILFCFSCGKQLSSFPIGTCLQCFIIQIHSHIQGLSELSLFPFCYAPCRCVNFLCLSRRKCVYYPFPCVVFTQCVGCESNKKQWVNCLFPFFIKIFINAKSTFQWTDSIIFQTLKLNLSCFGANVCPRVWPYVLVNCGSCV